MFRLTLPRLALLAVSSAAAALLVFSVACGGDDDSGSTGAGANYRRIEVSARDFSFDMPASIQGGMVRVSLKNDGREPHQSQLARLNQGVTLAQFQQALSSPDPGPALALVTLVGGPNAIAAGQTQDVIADLAPGTYVMLCFVPSPSDGVPHVAKGMLKSFEVTAPSGSQPQPPQTNNKVTLADFNFLGLETLPAGKTTIEVTNGGPQPHELTIVKLAQGVTVDQLRNALLSTEPPSGPPPFEDAGGSGGMSVGVKNWAEMDLTAGNYAFLCFIPDAQSGAPHAALGMLKGITVR